MLLPTISSRCQTVKFFRPRNLLQNQERVAREKEILKIFLQIISSTLSGKFKYVKTLDFDQQDAGEIFGVITKFLRLLLLNKIGAKQISESELTPEIRALSDKYSVEKLEKAIVLAEDVNSKLLFSNINAKLALEILLMEI